MPFLSDLNDWRATGPLPRPSPPKLPDQNFEKPILFSIFEKANNYVLKVTQPTVRGERPASYEICPRLTYSIGYWEIYRHFWGGGCFVLRVVFDREWGGKFPGGEFSRENLEMGGVLTEFL